MTTMSQGSAAWPTRAIILGSVLDGYCPLATQPFDRVRASCHSARPARRVRNRVRHSTGQDESRRSYHGRGQSALTLRSRGAFADPPVRFRFRELGRPDDSLGVAWPSMRIAFGRDLDALGVLLVATTAGYIAASLSSGRVLRHVNIGAGKLALSCLLTAFALYWVRDVARLAAGRRARFRPRRGRRRHRCGAQHLRRHQPRPAHAESATRVLRGRAPRSDPWIMTSVLSRGQPWQRGYAVVGVAQLVLAASFAPTIRRWPLTSGTASHAPLHATLRATLGILHARRRARVHRLCWRPNIDWGVDIETS